MNTAKLAAICVFVSGFGQHGIKSEDGVEQNWCMRFFCVTCSAYFVLRQTS